MTAISLFDVLAANDATDTQRMAQMTQFAGKLVDASLADWQRILDYEAEIGSLEIRDDEELAQVNQSLYALYENWAAEAGQVLARVRDFRIAGMPVAHADSLEDAHARMSNRLALTPAAFSRALKQVRQGQATPMQELRDELNARIRAGR